MKKILTISALSLALILSTGCGKSSNGSGNGKHTGNDRETQYGDDENKTEIEDVSLATSYMVNERAKVVTSKDTFGFRSMAYTLYDVLSTDIDRRYNKHIVISKDETKAYILVNHIGLEIIDITNTKNQKLLSFLNVGDDNYSITLSNDGTKAFIATSYSRKIIDITDAKNPKLLSSFDRDSAIALSNDGTKAFVSVSKQMKIMDITDAKNPKLLDTFDTKSYATEIILSKDETKAYLAEGDKGIEVIDFTYKNGPSAVGASDAINSFDTKGNINSMTLSNDGTKLYIAEGKDGIEIIDLNYERGPKAVGASDAISSFDTDGYANSIALSPDGKKAYVADGSQGIKILDITDITNLKEITNLREIKAPTLLSSFYAKGNVRSITLSTDGTRIYKTTKIIDLTSNTVERYKNFGGDDIGLVFEKSLGEVEVSITTDRDDIVKLGNYATTFNSAGSGYSNVYSIPISSVAGETGLTILTIKVKKDGKVGTRKIYLKVKEPTVTGNK